MGIVLDDPNDIPAVRLWKNLPYAVEDFRAEIAARWAVGNALERGELILELGLLFSRGRGQAGGLRDLPTGLKESLEAQWPQQMREIRNSGQITAMADPGAAAKNGVALDTNAIIARLEGAPADVQAVINAMGGRTPQVSITAVKEFLRGGGDVDALRSFLQSAGGGVGRVPSAATIQQLEALGLKAADARVVGSAIEDGVNVLTRDKKILNKVPGVAEKF